MKPLKPKRPRSPIAKALRLGNLQQKIIPSKKAKKLSAAAKAYILEEMVPTKTQQTLTE